jgi:hypothetical protein
MNASAVVAGNGNRGWYGWLTEVLSVEADWVELQCDRGGNRLSFVCAFQWRQRWSDSSSRWRDKGVYLLNQWE